MASRSRNEWVLFAAVLALLSAGTFARSVGFELVFDDHDLIENNPSLEPSASYLDLFRHDMWWWHGSGEFGHSFWRPMTLSFFRMIVDWFGMTARAFHACCVLLHSVVVLLLFGFVSRYLPVRVAFFAAALFALNPLRVESVAWVSGVGDVLCALFLLGSLWLHERAIQRRAYGPLALSLAVFLFALMSKESAFLFPCFLSFLVFSGMGTVPSREERHTRLRWVGAYWSVALAVGIYRSGVTESTLGSGTFSQSERILTAPVLFCRYLLDMVLPFDWTLHSTMVAVASPSDGRFVLSGITLVAMSVLLFWALSIGARGFLATAAWVSLFLAPVCLVGISTTLYAERYTYLPSMGISVLLVTLCHAGLSLLEKRRTGFMVGGTAVAVALVVVSSATSFDRSGAWRNDESLYKQMLLQDPGDPLPLYNLGMRAVAREDWDTARRYFERAIDSAPRHSRALNSLGNLAMMRGDEPAAMAYFRQSLESAPNPASMFNLAELLSRTDACSEAIMYYRQFLEHATQDLAQERRRAEEGMARLGSLMRAGLCH